MHVCASVNQNAYRFLNFSLLSCRVQHLTLYMAQFQYLENTFSPYSNTTCKLYKNIGFITKTHIWKNVISLAKIHRSWSDKKDGIYNLQLKKKLFKYQTKSIFKLGKISIKERGKWVCPNITRQKVAKLAVKNWISQKLLSVFWWNFQDLKNSSYPTI